MTVQSQSSAPLETRAVVDQMGRRVTVPVKPRRIVSLVPSQTELLFDLGVGDQVAGVTRYCLHPPEARQRCADIGGTKRFDFDAIQALQPDLILGNKEENYPEGIERLAESHPVWMSDIESIEQAVDMIRQVGHLVQRTTAAEALALEIDASWRRLKPLGGLSVVYLIWKKPFMAAGGQTFIHAVLEHLGLRNSVAHLTRYPELPLDKLAALEPDLLLLSSEPFPFTQAHVDELSQAMPSSRVLLVDGEPFSWYGSRMKRAPDYFDRLGSDLEALA